MRGYCPDSSRRYRASVRHYEDLVAVLRDQVGVPPAAETEALYRRLLSGQ